MPSKPPARTPKPASKAPTRSPKPPKDDPTNSTFASRRAASGGPQPRRRTTLRAGAEAEQDFTITTVTDSETGGDRVQPITV